MPDDLTTLYLGATKVRRFSLAVLHRFARLRVLSLEGYRTDIEALGRLAALEALTLRSITLPDLRPLLPLPRLRALALRLGGTTDLGLLPELGCLRAVELMLIRGLADVGPVGAIPTLERLSLQALRRVDHLPDLRAAAALRCVHLDTLRGLRDLTPLCACPALEEVHLLNMGHLEVDDVRCLQQLPTLRRLAVGLGSTRKNAAVRALLPVPAPHPYRREFG